MLINQRLHLCVDCCSYVPISLDGPKNCQKPLQALRIWFDRRRGGKCNSLGQVEYLWKMDKSSSRHGYIIQMFEDLEGPNMYHKHVWIKNHWTFRAVNR